MLLIDSILKTERYFKLFKLFISAFDSAPLSIDNTYAVEGKNDLFQKGLDIITKLTDVIKLGCLGFRS